MIPDNGPFKEAVDLMNSGREADLVEVRKTLGMKIVSPYRYEQALNLFETTLREDPDNPDIHFWIEACRIMLQPYEPVQHTDSAGGEQMVIRQLSTPWEQRAYYLGALDELGRQALSETAEAYSAAEQKALKQAETILAQAELKTGMSESDLAQFRNELGQLQESLDREWKGHGPDILKHSLDKLNRMISEKG